jgi:hypothetical protein
MATIVIYPQTPLATPGGDLGVRVLPLETVKDRKGRVLPLLPRGQFSSMFVEDVEKVAATTIVVGHDNIERIRLTAELPADTILLGVIVREGNLGRRDFPRLMAVSPGKRQGFLLRLANLLDEAAAGKCAEAAGGKGAEDAGGVGAEDAGVEEGAKPAHAMSLLSYMVGVLLTPDSIAAKVTYAAGDTVSLIECVEHWGKECDRTVAFATPDQILGCESPC